MSWVKLDDRFWCNERILAVGNEAAGAFARLLSYAGSAEDDGRVPAQIVEFVTCRRKTIVDALLTAGLLVENGTGYVIPDYLKFNHSKQELEEMRKQKAAAGRLGGLAKARAGAKAGAKADV